MSKLVKIILVVALAIFVIGFIWAIVATLKRSNTAVDLPPEEKKEQREEEEKKEAPDEEKEDKKEEPVADNPENEPKGTPPAPITKKREVVRSYTPVQRQQIITHHYPTAQSYPIETRSQSSAEAWARSGVDANGNAYAEAHAN